MSHDNIEKHVKIYKNVFIALLVFTVITVGASYIHFNAVWLGILIGLLIAAVKGYLVAANFMHLNDEKKTIYWLLILTAGFFALLFFIPILFKGNTVKTQDYFWDDIKVEQVEDHGGSH